MSTGESDGPSRGWFVRLLLPPIAAVALYVLIDLIDKRASLLAAASPGVRRALFVSIAATSGALFGFAVTGVTILLSVGEGPRMAWLSRQSLFRQEARLLFTSAIAALALASVVFPVLIVVGSKDSFSLVWGLLAAATIASVLDRLARLVAFLDRLMRVALTDAAGAPQANPPFNEPLEN